MLIEQSIGEFSDAQPLLNGSAASSNVLDLVAARHQIGVGRDLFIWLTVNVVESGADNDTYVFIFQTDTAEDFSGGPKEVFRVSLTGDDARLKTAGEPIWCSTVPQTADQRYVRWYYTLADVGGTAAVTVDAAFGPDRPHSIRSRDQVYVSNVGNP